jgi:ABC-type oligopeptide transport system substrate-binding subunit/serine/threonine protein kinase
MIMFGSYLDNRYRLDAELGHGGMGTVYRAYDTVLDRPVAIKVLSSSALGTEGKARLLREARAVAKLNHPNIMTVFDVGEDSGAPFIVMELIAGESLREYQPATLDETIRIGAQICLALEQAHAHDIIHRDLKPENVMLLNPHPQPLSLAASRPAAAWTRDGRGEQVVRVKLMDFGLAFTSGATRLTQEGEVIGTVTYLAPELIEGKPATPASDLYALGVMLYELTAKRPPFTGDTLMMVLSQHLYAPVVPPSTYNPEIPPALDALIVRLLAKHPEERPASAEKVRHTLETLDQASAITLFDDVPTELSLLDRIARGRLVGREHELSEANAIWQRAQAGEGQVLLISGESGIGKTRFARELMAQARVSGAQVLVGECYAESGAPYAPLAQVIQASQDLTGFQNLSGLTSSLIADLITIAPALRANFPDVPPNPPLEPQAEQQRLFEHAVSFFAGLTERQPVLLVIDDAHWADSATLSLLRHVARRSRSLRLLIALTYREIELDEARPFSAVLLDLNRERLATRIKLGRLDREQTRSMLTAMFQREITSEFLDGIYRETEGNPFFIEEVCKELVEAGTLCCTNGHWQLASLDEIEIPQNVKMTIQARVSKLPDHTQDTLRLAAVLGREFDFDTLQAMSDLSEDALIEALEIAQRAQLIDELPRARGTSNLTFAFAHALIPSTLHDGLSGLRRQRLHRRAAQAIERVFHDRVEEFAAQLGRHYAEAGEREKAIEYLLQAGDQARRVYAYEAAIQHDRQALAFLKEEGTIGLARAARTAMKLGGLYHSFMDYEQARQAYDEAFELWQRASERQAQALLPTAPHALRGYWGTDYSTLDPAYAATAADVELVEQLFAGLIELSTEFDLVPVLAWRWEILDGGRRYVFHLRRDFCWSDGTAITAHDVEYAWRRLMNSTPAAPNAQFLDGVTVAQAVDDFTFVVELHEPIGHFLYLLTLPATFPVPRHIVEPYGSAWTQIEHLVTSGPFRLAGWEPNRLITLARNSDYHGPAAGNLARVELSLPQSRANDTFLDPYEADAHDVASLDNPDLIEYGRQRHPDEYVTQPALYTLYLCFDSTRPPFDDVRVRRAFVHAADRQTLVNVVYRGSVTPATGGLVPPGMPGHLVDGALAYDPDRARRLLAEAGYASGRELPVIEAWTSESVVMSPGPAYLTTQWRDHLGVQVQWKTLEWNIYNQQLLIGTPHIYRLAWIADYPDPDSFLRLALHQPYVRLHHARFEELLTTARRIADPTERLKFYQAADRLLIDEALIMPLLHTRHHYLLKPWLKRYPITPLKASYWKDAIIEPH